MSHKASENHKHLIDKINPFIPIIDTSLPGEYWGAITEVAAPGVLPYYAISNYGRVVHIYEKKFMSLSWDGPGYVTAVLRTINGTKTFRVHRLMMMTFRYMPGCEKLLVDHINRDRKGNWIDVPVLDPATGQYVLKSNLRWATRKVNRENSDLPNRLTEEKVREICKLLEQGYPASYVSKLFNLSFNTVAYIRNGHSWAHISKDYNIPAEPTISGRQRKISEEQVKTICELLEKKVPVPEILNIIGLPYSKRHFIYSIKKRECYSDISKNYNF